jgi:hypothetical protein
MAAALGQQRPLFTGWSGSPSTVKVPVEFLFTIIPQFVWQNWQSVRIVLPAINITFIVEAYPQYIAKMLMG